MVDQTTQCIFMIKIPAQLNAPGGVRWYNGMKRERVLQPLDYYPFSVGYYPIMFSPSLALSKTSAMPSIYGSTVAFSKKDEI